MTNFQFEIDQYLSSFINHEHHLNKAASTDFKLERIAFLLQLAGDPQKNLKIIHIAGSKGKGSTAAMTAHILKSAGYKVGLYTSPHIENYKERIRILDAKDQRNEGGLFNDAIGDEKLAFLLKHLSPLVEEVSLRGFGAVTFYELFTALAFCYFNDQKTDLVVLETGLGGRLDATNAAESLIAAITAISLEHTNLLGDTLPKIAYEKACIIKEGTKQVVLAKQNEEVMKVVFDQCKKYGIEPIIAGMDVVCTIRGQDQKAQVFDISSGHFQLKEAVLPLLGKYQITNAQVSLGIIGALKMLGYAISDGAVRDGFGASFWPCRFEIIQENPLIILDAAHTQDSIEGLIKTCGSIYPGKKPVVVVGVSEDKDREAIIKGLNKFAGLIIFTKAQHPRAHYFSEGEIKKILPDGKFEFSETVQEACKQAKEKVGDNGYILITGSVFVVSEARGLCIS